MSAYQTIDYSVLDNIATITFSRPDSMNVYSCRMMEEMIDAFDHSDADDDVRAVIVTGSGHAFCAGIDLADGAFVFNRVGTVESPFREDGSLDFSREGARDGGGRLTLRIFQSLKPVIAAINGPAIGIGATMTLPMDIRIAAHTARFGFVFSRRGLVPEAGSSWFLPRIVGIERALRWCLSGRILSASEALEGSLVSELAPADGLIARAREIAREIVDHAAPVSAAITRRLLWEGIGATHPMMAHRIDSRAILTRSMSADVEEGFASFLEKRAPAFPDSVTDKKSEFLAWWEKPNFA